jgi:hypothetical protein
MKLISGTAASANITATFPLRAAANRLAARRVRLKMAEPSIRALIKFWLVRHIGVCG